MYEPKGDGYRIAFVREATAARPWSRQGRDLTDRFPDLAGAALDRFEAGIVLDGEAVIWNGTRLDFDLLQRRLVNPPRQVATLVGRNPASLMVFDVVAPAGNDMRRRPLHERRGLLKQVAGAWPPASALARHERREHRPALDDHHRSRLPRHLGGVSVSGVRMSGRSSPQQRGRRHGCPGGL